MHVAHEILPSANGDEEDHVSLPAEVAARVERAAARAGSVSAWVTDSVTRTLGEEELRDRFLAFCDAGCVLRSMAAMPRPSGSAHHTGSE